MFLLGLLPFVHGAGYGFAPCDDYDYAVTPPAVRQGLTMASTVWAATTIEGGIWMPMTRISYLMDYTLSKFHRSLLSASAAKHDGFMETAVSGTMHLHSVVIHGLNAALLFLLLAALARAGGGGGMALPFLAALFWAIHPLRVESVQWIASRKDVLSMAGLLTALLFWVRWSMDASHRLWNYAWSLLSFLFAAAAKPSVVVFPWLILTIDLLVLNRFSVGDLSDAKKRGRVLIPYLLPAILSAGLCVFAAWAQGQGGGWNSRAAFPLMFKLLTPCAAFGLYVFNTTVPAMLAVDCVFKYPDMPRFWMPGVVLTVVAAMGMHKWTSRIWREESRPRFVLAGLLCFIGALLPFLTGFGIHASADRFTYIPAIGISVALLGIMRLERKLRRGIGVLLTALVIGECALCWRQVSFWRNDDTLYSHTLDVDGDDNVRAWGVRACYEWEVRHDPVRAAAYFDHAYRRNPQRMADFVHLYVIALAEAGRVKDAGRVLDDIKASVFGCREQEEEDGRFSPAAQMDIRLRIARLAYYMADPDYRDLAPDEADLLAKEHPDEILGKYLRMRLAGELGNTEAAAELNAELTAAEAPCYLRCRFLGKSGSGGISDKNR